MAKYILKRLGLSVIILLGVSVIIYFLARLMPADYLETKFSAQLREGTMTQEKLDDFRKQYGLFKPEAYVDVTFPDGFENDAFRKDTKERNYEDVRDEAITYGEFYAGTYTAKKAHLTLFLDVESSSYRVLDEEEQVVDAGSWNAEEGVVVLQSSSGSELRGEASYSLAKFGNKFGAVMQGYFRWLGNMLRGNLGESFIHQRPVAEVIGEHMWISFFIALVAMVLEFAIAIPMGITSATHQYSVRDYTVTVITMIGISLPSFFFAALLIKVFSSWLGWFPTSGLVSGTSASVGFAHVLDILWHLALPMTVLVVLSVGGMMRYTRTNMLEVLNSDYIRTARAKGLSEKKVIYVHAFRNTMIPLMTLVAGILPSLFGGSMITEEVFSIDGIGRLAYKALQQGDIPFIMGYNMFLAVLTVIGTLFSDLMYAVVDPRVKLSK